MRILIGLAMAAIVGLSAAYSFSPRATPPLAANRLEECPPESSNCVRRPSTG